MLLLPSLDLRGGECVRLLKGDFAAETRYPVRAQDLLARYRRLGAPWVHVVDLDGARDGALANRRLIASLATESGLRLQVGGGVRSAATVAELLGLGVARVVVGSAAIEEPAAVRGWFERFGPERICLALDIHFDAAGVPRIRTRGWTRETALSLWEAIALYAGVGLRHVLCTDIERDGALAGPSVALYAEALRRHPELAWQASGGVRDHRDLAALAATGVAAAISGKALLEERIRAEDLQPFLPSASSPA
jgi:phosphoribosylformimino-5-aminoimidazole carboxamide ribotide isomerase